jgi:hypothetical protein
MWILLGFGKAIVGRVSELRAEPTSKWYIAEVIGSADSSAQDPMIRRREISLFQTGNLMRREER